MDILNYIFFCSRNRGTPLIPESTGATRMGLQSYKYNTVHPLLKEYGEYKTAHGVVICSRTGLINISQMLGILGILAKF